MFASLLSYYYVTDFKEKCVELLCGWEALISETQRRGPGHVQSKHHIVCVADPCADSYKSKSRELLYVVAFWSDSGVLK